MAGFLFTSCESIQDDGKTEEQKHIIEVNTEIQQMMTEVYLWYDKMPANVDPRNFSDPADYIAALRYDEFDRWSTALTAADFNQYFEEGAMIGHGFMVGLDQGGNFRIISVYRNTEPAQKGIKRGWIISKINGTVLTTTNYSALMGPSESGIVNNFEFIDENGVTQNISLTKAEISLTPVIDYEVITQGSTKIGYMVFQDFIETANAELDEVFDSLTRVGIDEMIIDLRYNGGGSVDVAEHLAGWLIGKNFGGEPFIYYQHNRKLAPYYDTMYTVPANANGLALSRLFFIGTDNTASASELVINGVDPFIPAILAGSTTHGKPVGMYAIPVLDYVTLPVSFKYTNKNHEGDFYNGLVPDLPASDDFSKDFGDPEEASLKAILDFIETGNTPLKSTRALDYKPVIMKTGKPLDLFIRAF
jgi:C-terminal processing protease CtpA/Prc